MRPKRGDMVTAAFQGDLKKPRPAVILHADEFIEAHESLILCAFTSSLADAPSFRPTIEPTAGNGLEVTSQIMVDKITHLRKAAIRQVIGRLSDEDMQRLETALITITGLHRTILPLLAAGR
ncbi:type II toxin-antitoxin system PemK/MazF family toxin [Rhizobium sp. CC-YZS058]|uniref:type II toxin-antitoxin system PemK/MazF family toxin n=1 Tax=Rhizobium sp. CC-YZS058 TaxID=3042153 RepID=UPI002B056D81|nr:type II toxin-antitoxin system PemK/MazF family toxin [Rhizobium sp. CC-YZS058]MEA3534019.1 type II toxin-antitoxin system PemK/MazF family toxin [Rhizobium sp. CC-YZS058]